MKKNLIVILIGATLSLIGCGTAISQEDYDAQNKALQELQADYNAKVTELKNIQENYNAQTKELNSTKEKLKETQNELNVVKSELDEMQKEFDALNKNNNGSEFETTNIVEETTKPTSDTEKNIEFSINSVAKKIFGSSNILVSKKFALLKKPVNPSRFRTHPAVPELSALCIILAVFLKGGKNVSADSA